MRSPAAMDIIQIDANVACHKKCSNCTRLVAHNATKWEMTPEQAKTAIQSMKGWYTPGKVLGLIGGEVTLHSQFEAIARVFRENWNPHIPTHVGRKPIKDLNVFAEERLYDRTSGRGLWTSLGAGFYKHMEVICDTFDHFNTNTHEAGGQHQSLLITRDEYCAATGMPDDQWLANRDLCWVQNLWSASVNDRGAYFCEVAGSIDRTLFDGKHAWPVEKGWWQRKPSEFGEQLNLCNYCALAQPGPSQVDSAERDIISAKNRMSLQMAGSPAIRKERYEKWEDHCQEKRVVDTKDNYVSGYRVAPDHKSILPKTLSCVVVCVGYADKLKHTLAHNLELVYQLVVVTHPDDHETCNLVQGMQVRAPMQKLILIKSVRCYQDDHAFNKGKMLNDGLAALQNPDWIVLTDADVLLHPYLLSYVKSHALNPGCLYGTERYDLPYQEQISWIAKHFKTDAMIPASAHKPSGVNAEPNGFMQIFHPRAQAIRERWPQVMSEEFCSAGGIDSWFMQQWPADKRVMIPEIPVVHIAHGEFGANWNGTGNRKSVWRQCGVITERGITWLDGLDWSSSKLRLTDTLHGRSLEVAFPSGDAFPPEVLRADKQGLVFDNVPIGHHHIHLARWDDE